MSQSYVPVALVRAVTERASGQCEYCRCLTGFSSDPFAVEHIITEARGGATEAANLRYSSVLERLEARQGSENRITL